MEPIENTTSAKAFLYTEDEDLVGSTIEYWQLLDLTDGQTELHVATITVTFVGAPLQENRAPYFKPELTGMIQIYK